MAEIDLTPTEEMAANAARGLELRRKHGKGGTEIGVARARDISNRKNLSPETVRRMHAFFSRHEKNKAGGEDDAGYIAWLLWGGDSGQSWAKRKVEQMNKGENQRSDTYKEIAQRLGSVAKMGVQYVAPRSPVSKPERKYRVRLESRDTGKTIDFRTMATSDADARYQADAAYGKKWQILAVIEEHSRSGAKAKFAADAREVGNEILRQLGGGRFMSMVGGKNAMYGTFGGKPGLQVSIGKGAEGGINRVIVTLDPATDTYRMEFWKIAKGGMSTQKVSEASMVYADDLQRVFTDRTRFYTSMSRPGAKAKFGMTNAGYKALVDAIRVYGDSAPAAVVAQAKQMKQEPTEFTDNEVMAVIAKMKQARASRPGAKAKMAVEAGWRVSPDAKSSGLTVTELLPKLAKGHTFYANLKSGGTVSGTLKAFSTNGVKIDKYGDVTDLRWSDIASIGAGNIGTGPYPIRASRPGAKAKMEMPSAKSVAINEKIAALLDKGVPIREAVERVMGPGSWETVGGAIYDALRKKRGMSRPGAKAKFAADAREVGNEILRQLGGGRFMSMVGGKNAMYGTFGGKPGLQVTIGKGAEGGINRVIITLDPATDTYRMEFWKIAKGGMSTQRVSEAGMVYADDLQRVFTDRTKFYTSMSRPGAKAKMGRTSEEYAEDVQNTWAIISRWVDSLRSPLMMENYREARQIVSKLAQVFARFEKELASPVTRLSRPGAKAKFGDVGSDDNKIRYLLGEAESAIQHNAGSSIAAGFVKKAEALVQDKTPADLRSRIQRVKSMMKDSNAVREGEKVSASDDAVSRKIRKLMDEGKPQKQAVAIALDLERRGEL